MNTKLVICLSKVYVLVVVLVIVRVKKYFVLRYDGNLDGYKDLPNGI